MLPMSRKLIALLIIIGLVGVFIAYLLLNGYRDTVSTEADLELTLSSFVNEYLDDATAANGKYLSDDGGSHILALSGVVTDIMTSADGRPIVLLGSSDALAKMQCLFAEGQSLPEFKKGEPVTIKGVLRAGPGYDADLEMYENGYLEECSLLP